MKSILIILMIFLVTNCSKPKTVLICGDHVCINKDEAEHFFNENHTLEVRILNKKAKEEIDLVELNLKENIKGKKEIQVFSKKETEKKVKILSKKDKNEIRKMIKNKKKEEKIKQTKKKKKKEFENKKTKKNSANKNKRIDVVDVCTIVKKCNIEEISKYLINKGKDKKFPDITTRQ
tara:strand:+ start:1373 stop:1903 length:531 start_codon:yes stop_codon:yes gene_type:complete